MRYVLIILLAFLSGCATLQEAYSPSSLDQRITSTQTQWRKYGAGFSLATPPSASPSPELQSILSRLVAVSPLQGSPVKAYLINDDVVNAESNGNSIYFHRGLLNLLGNDEIRVAGIMGHELGHIIGNHVKGQATRMTIDALLAALAQRAGKGSASQLLEQALGLGSAAYSRKAEKEADVIGAVLAHRAGYDSRGLIEFFNLAKRKQEVDLARSSRLLAPLVSSYNQSVRNFHSNVALYQKTGSRRAHDEANYWADLAGQNALSIKQVLYQYQNYLGAVNPLFLDHPPDEERVRVISLVREKELEGYSVNWLYQQDPEVYEIYETIVKRLPR